jgi:hypothetical protein
MKYTSKDMNEYSISEIERDVLTPSDNQACETYEKMHRQLMEEYIMEDTRLYITTIQDDNNTNFELPKETIRSNYDGHRSQKEVREHEFEQAQQYNSISVSKHTASFHDYESSNNKNYNNDLEKFYEEKQSKMDEIISKRSGSVKKNNTSTSNAQRDNHRSKNVQTALKQNNNSNTIRRSNSLRNFQENKQENKKTQVDKTSTITYNDFKKEEKKKPEKTINIKLKITNNSIEEIIDFKPVNTTKSILKPKEDNLFRKSIQKGSVKISPHNKTNGSISKLDVSLNDKKSSHTKDNLFKNNNNEAKVVKYTPSEIDKDKSTNFGVEIDKETINEVVSDIKSNMNKNLSVRKISLNNDDKSMLTHNISEIKGDRKRSYSL